MRLPPTTMCRLTFWWHGVNYINVIPEELIDAVLASEKKEREDKKNGKTASKQ